MMHGKLSGIEMAIRCQGTGLQKNAQRKSEGARGSAVEKKRALHQLDQVDQRVLTNLTNLQELDILKNMKFSATRPPGKPARKYGKPLQVNLYEAKTQLSSLVERAAKGEEIVIAKAGKPMARLARVAPTELPRMPGGNFMGISYIADDFDAPLPEDVLKDFGL
jgi:prevent-host-death family protein